MSAQEFDVIVYGATGFTGGWWPSTCCATYGAEGEVRWAMAGRDVEKLKAVAHDIGAPYGAAADRSPARPTPARSTRWRTARAW